MSTQRRGVFYIYPHRHFPVQMARTAGKRQISSAEAVAQQQRNKQAERARREALHRERKIASYLAEDDNFPSFAIQLAKYGLQLRDIPGDGNCLFRALGDQLEGHGRSHFKHRLDVANFMYQHRKDFEPFVEDNISFDNHVSNLRQLGTYAGNDAIVAFARLNSVNIIIHQLAAPFLEIHGSPNPNARQLHIAYHNGDHYSSVRKRNDNTESPANISLQIGDKTDTKQNSLKKEGYSQSYNGYHNNEESVLFTRGDGMARVLRDETSIEQQVITATGCKGYANGFELRPIVFSLEAFKNSGLRDDEGKLTNISRLLRDLPTYMERGNQLELDLNHTNCIDERIISHCWLTICLGHGDCPVHLTETYPRDIETVRQSLYENDFDVETAITDVFQLMEITNKSDTASVTSQMTADSGLWSDNGTGSRVICSTTSPSHPVSHGHSRDNSLASSGYGSLSSNHGGARPKNPVKNNQNMSARQKRDQKKMEKKKRAEERHRQNILGLAPRVESDEELNGPDVIRIAAKDAAVIRG